MTTGSHDPERKLDAALQRLVRVEAPAALRSRIETAIDTRQAAEASPGRWNSSTGGPNFSSAGRRLPVPARFALAAATLVVLCLAGWWWLSRPALLPSTVVGGIDPGTTAPVLSAAAVLVPAPSSAEQPQPRPVRTATASLPAAPVQSARAQTSDEEYSLPPLPEPPETQFDDVAPAPLLVARLDEPAPIEIKPLVFAPDPPDDNGAGDSRW